MTFQPNTIGAVFIGPASWVVTFAIVGGVFATTGNATPITKGEDISVSLTTIMAIAGTVAGAVVTAYLALIRYTIGQEKKRIDDLFKNQEEKVKMISDNFKDMQQENKRETRDDMSSKIEFARMQSTLNSINLTTTELKATQLQRVEWEAWTSSNEKRLEALESQYKDLKNTMSRWSGQYSATPFKKKEE